MTNDEAMSLFERAGALLTGHFKLSSGLHSSTYLEKFRLVESPALLDPMCAELASRFAGDSVDIVLGPTTAGIILAYNVARHLGVEARFAEPQGEERTLRRGQVLPSGSRVLIVDDILTTGGSVRECLAIVEAHDAVLVGVGVMGDRTGGKIDFGARFEAILTTVVDAYSEGDCPMCRSGMPLTQRGTRGLSAVGAT